MKAHLKLTARTIAVLFLLIFALTILFPQTGMAQLGQMGDPRPAATEPQYGIAFKRPVMQAACRNCPWGALGDAVKAAMAPYGYDVAICYSCSGGDAVHVVAKHLISPEITDRQAAEGTVYRPEAKIEFGVTGLGSVRQGYEGTLPINKTDGPYTNLRAIARIDGVAGYTMMAVTKESGITDLSEIAAKKMPVRILGNNDAILAYYGLNKKDIISWGGQFLDGSAIKKNANFDVIIGNGSLANNPEGNMWYEMTQKRDLIFLSLPEGLRDQLVKDGHSVKVNLPFRYMRGVGDQPIASVSGIDGSVVYGTADLPDQFVRDVAKAIDEKRAVLKWTNLSYFYDPTNVWNTGTLPLHPAAAAYYRERGYMPPDGKTPKK